MKVRELVERLQAVDPELKLTVSLSADEHDDGTAVVGTVDNVTSSRSWCWIWGTRDN